MLWNCRRYPRDTQDKTLRSRGSKLRFTLSPRRLHGGSGPLGDATPRNVAASRVAARSRARRRTIAWAILLPVLFAFPLLSAGSGPQHELPKHELELGANFHGASPEYTDEEREEILDKLQAAGIRWIRMDLRWGLFEPDEAGKVDRAYTELVDSVVNRIRRHQMKLLVVILQTPAWADCTGHGGDKYPPCNPSEFGRFMRWLAGHMNGRVDAWEIWNEPNSPDFFVGDPTTYVALLREGYENLKAVDAAVPVVLGAPIYNDTQWLGDAYRSGARRWFDVLAIHPYQGQSDRPPGTPPWDYSKDKWALAAVGAVRSLMVRNGDEAKPIWFTEFGWSSHPNDGDEPPWKLGVTEKDQGAYLLGAIEYVRTQAPYVKKMFWYQALDSRHLDAHENGFGLLRDDLREKPAYWQLYRYSHNTAGSYQ
jgi:polysaccharide biosynthesis protein PslG